MNKLENLTKGFIKENPIFVYLLGMCPALAVTSTFETALGMGFLVIFVLTLSNVVVSLVKDLIPAQIKIPAYIVIIATFVTVVKMLSEAYAIDLYLSLGVFIPLIVVNCLILGRAESFASKNTVSDSAIDGLGMGLGFTFGLIIIGVIRELLGTGSIMYGVYLPFPKEEGYLFTIDWFVSDPDFKIADYAIAMFTNAPGAFITIGVLLAISNLVTKNKKNKKIAQAKKAAAEKKAAATKKVGEVA